MESKKIIDYKIVSESTTFVKSQGGTGYDFLNKFSSNAESLNRLDNEIQLLNIQLNENKNVLIMIDEFLKREINTQYQAFSKKEKAFFSLFNGFHLFENSNSEVYIHTQEIQDYLLDRKKSIINTIDMISRNLTKIETKFEDEKYKEEFIFETIQNSLLHRESLPLEKLVLFYIGQGYVPIGGINEKNGTGYQAMVKYEE